MPHKGRWTGTAAPAAGTGAGMTAAYDEPAGGCGGDGTGLPASVTDGRVQGVLSRIMARKRPDLPAVEQKKRLLVSRSMVESSERPMAVVGRRPSGKSRLKDPNASIALFYRSLPVAAIGGQSLLAERAAAANAAG